MVQNPDRLPDHVVDLRQLHKVEAGEVNGRKCVSLFFTAKLQKSKEAVTFICTLLLPYMAFLCCTLLQVMHVSFDAPVELAAFQEVLQAKKQ